MSRYRTNTKKPTNRKKKYREGGPVGEPVMLDEVDVVAPKFKAKGFNPIMNAIRRRIARNVDPMSYTDAASRLAEAVFLDKNTTGFFPREERNALFDIMMGQPVRESAVGALQTSPYRPTNSKDPNAVYLRSPQTEKEIRDRIKTNFSFGPRAEFDKEEFLRAYPEQFNKSENKMMNRKPDGTLFPAFGESFDGVAFLGQGTDQTNLPGSTLANFTIGQGEDERGKYISYYDIWDLAPYGRGKVNDYIQNKAGVKPQEVYGRLYYRENEDGTLEYLDDPVPVLQETDEYYERTSEIDRKRRERKREERASKLDPKSKRYRPFAGF